ncbi:CagC family type IV secretion system protein (plasmid) [Bacillus subtilis]|uniref:CagC family type IV secretion system protein n=1 Tax=Bacillus subtilis TaxID=1423 RepID=A0A8I2BAK6_BACIU|nr:CagC family type IV secretion system protein [Bacillus subtilis]MBO3796456.1 hypothetical protein [Bacillus subtilis]MCM3191292.1 CagC family type IV secretion system protein [Bacillus subtilis]WEY82949.1 CagC family type IV secretion system protein [Bacillus subtilis]
MNKIKAFITDKKILFALGLSLALVVMVMPDSVVLAASEAGQAKQKVTKGLKVILTVITAAIVLCGGIGAGKLISVKVASGLDDPHTKNEMWKGLGAIGAGVAAGGALTWLLPWLFGLFN